MEPNWLEKGWTVFRGSITDRPFLLPLPAPDFMTMSRKEPSYTQLCAASRKLLCDTPCFKTCADVDNWNGGYQLVDQMLLTIGAQGFWTGHSSRATLATWAACVKISKDRRDYIGRWKPSESDEYVRTSREIVWGIQQEVATAIRNGGLDDVCFEDGVLTELADYCRELGVVEEEILNMGERLVAARGLLPQSAFSRPVLKVSQEVVEAPEDNPRGSVAPEVHLELHDQEVVLSEGCWAVSCKSSGAAETLHQIGRCWRRPGVHYRRFVILDDGEIQENKNVKDARLYSRICSDCFPRGLQQELDGIEEESLSGSSGTSDSEVEL